MSILDTSKRSNMPYLKNVGITQVGQGAGKESTEAKDIGINAYTKHPRAAFLETGEFDEKNNAKESRQTYSPRGVLDIGNLLEFAPYETGYCFLVVLGAPYCMKISRNGVYDKGCYNYKLQRAFINMLEREFKGLDGIDDITSESAEVTNNIVTSSFITKTQFPSVSQITMRFTEKTGGLITKYTSTFLRMIRDPVSLAKTYNGAIVYNNIDKHDFTNPCSQLEEFNMLYIITDSTCLRVEKAFLLVNMQPTTAAYSEVYNFEKGDVQTKEISIPFKGNVLDCRMANYMAKAYVHKLINNETDIEESKINVNSAEFNYSFADYDGRIRKIRDISDSDGKTVESIMNN